VFGLTLKWRILPEQNKEVLVLLDKILEQEVLIDILLRRIRNLRHPNQCFCVTDRNVPIVVPFKTEVLLNLRSQFWIYWFTLIKLLNQIKEFIKVFSIVKIINECFDSDNHFLEALDNNSEE
jgi:hypothetical protein